MPYFLTLNLWQINLIHVPDSPRYLEVSVEDEMLKNEVLHSEATAFANMVLPVPVIINKKCFPRKFAS